MATQQVTNRQITDIAFSKITGLPSTLAGYGISTALTGDGTASAPAVSYVSEPTLGWYRHAAGKSYLRNKADQDMYLGLRSGDTAEQRAYLAFSDRDGNNEWLVGKNAATKFILYENDSAVHRMNCYPSGTTELNSVGINPVRINFLETDRTTSLGTGGLEVWSGSDPSIPVVVMNPTQGVSLYGNFVDGSNYERGYMRWLSNVLYIGTDKAGTGTNRPVGIWSSGSVAATFGASSMSLARSLLFATDATFDIGSTGASRPRHVVLSGYHELSEQAGDPAAPAANNARLYAKDVGGKTALIIRFPTGAVQQIAIEP